VSFTLELTAEQEALRAKPHAFTRDRRMEAPR
jgi:hypothetical protein